MRNPSGNISIILFNKREMMNVKRYERRECECDCEYDDCDCERTVVRFTMPTYSPMTSEGSISLAATASYCLAYLGSVFPGEKKNEKVSL
jgi:hypothetical protein